MWKKNRATLHFLLYQLHLVRSIHFKLDRAFAVCGVCPTDRIFEGLNGNGQ